MNINTCYIGQAASQSGKYPPSIRSSASGRLRTVLTLYINSRSQYLALRKQGGTVLSKLRSILEASKQSRYFTLQLAPWCSHAPMPAASSTLRVSCRIISHTHYPHLNISHKKPARRPAIFLDSPSPWQLYSSHLISSHLISSHLISSQSSGRISAHHTHAQ